MILGIYNKQNFCSILMFCLLNKRYTTYFVKNYSNTYGKLRNCTSISDQNNVFRNTTCIIKKILTLAIMY